MGWRRFFGCLMLITALPLVSAGWQWPFQVLGPDQGLPNGAITCLAEDADGFIWLGTESGLLRYEGGRCTRWGREQGLPSAYVSRILANADGSLWVSTNLGLGLLRRGTYEAVRFPLAGPVAPSGMVLDASGRLWVTTSQGLFVQKDGMTFDRHPQGPPGRLSAIQAGSAGAVFVGSEAGLTEFRLDGSFTFWGKAQGLPKEGVSMVLEDGAGRVWAGSGRTLAMKAPGALRFTDQSKLLKASLSPNSLPFADRDGSIWLPTQGGAMQLAGLNPLYLDASQGLPMRWVRTILRDRDGSLWILGASLARLLGGERLWNHPLSSGPSGEVVWCIQRDPAGNLLAATDDGAVQVGPSGVQRIPGTEGHRIKYLAQDRSGTLWMVSTIGPALWLKRGASQAEIAPLGDLGYGLNTVMVDSLGRLWFGHPHLGMLRWDPTLRRLIQEVPVRPSENLGVFQIREDGGGRLWAASSQGLYLRNPAEGTWRLFTEKDGLLPFGLYGMAFLPDGSAWIHSREPQGIQRIRIDGDRLQVLDQRRKGQGLHSDLVYAVEVDDKGRTWTTSDQGVDCLDLHLHLGHRQGMVSEDCAILALLADRGQIWVGTAAGLVRYKPSDQESRPLIPRPYILQVMKGAQTLDAPSGGLGSFGAKDSTLVFRVAVPGFQDPETVKIQVRLLGLETAWRDLDAPMARYPALSGGNYTFEARTVRLDGEKSPVTALDFQIRPPWWRAWWALLLWGAAAIGTVLTIFRMRVAALAKSKAELELLVASRTEELRARNCELTEAMGRVKQLSGLLPICASCKKIRDDKGYWSQLEHYFSEHSEVGFTHGICPDCAGQFFPDHRKRGVPPST